MKKFILFILLIMFFAVLTLVAKADQITDLQKQIDSLNSQKSGKVVDRQKVRTQLDNIAIGIATAEKEIRQKEVEVKNGEEALKYQKTLLNERARSYYKNVNRSSLNLLTILTSSNLSESLRDFFYQKSLVDQDKNTIIKVVLYIKNLEEIKTKLTEEKVQLASLKIQVAEIERKLNEDISKIEQQIAELSALQQQLIAQKQASLGISRSASSLGRCDSDLTNGRDPGFSPKIAFFTYGVPNRVGMNQWGAYGRAKAGQNYEQILQAYYSYDSLQGFDTNMTINVDGHGSFSLEDYIKRIYEVPGDWPSEVLKAQAVAARSYALAYTNKGAGSICATESCQVFQDNPKGGAWEQAVNDTAGKAMVQSGNPIKAWFSSTHGGYIFSSSEIGWSGTSWTKHANDFEGSVGSFSDLASKAYDRESPWFYCDWGSRSEFNKTAWLKPQELADVANIILLVKNDSSTSDHLYQPDKSNPAGTDTWDFEKVRSELRSRGISPFSLVSDVSVSADFGSGRSSSVNISGDGGSVSFSASEFKDWFNLRAPANIQIVGPLFNVERR